jgi:hypothetical protein
MRRARGCVGHAARRRRANSRDSGSYALCMQWQFCRDIERHLIRSGHCGQGSYEPHQQSEHVAASTSDAEQRFLSASSEPLRMALSCRSAMSAHQSQLDASGLVMSLSSHDVPLAGGRRREKQIVSVHRRHALFRYAARFRMRPVRPIGPATTAALADRPWLAATTFRGSTFCHRVGASSGVTFAEDSMRR